MDIEEYLVKLLEKHPDPRKGVAGNGNEVFTDRRGGTQYYRIGNGNKCVINDNTSLLKVKKAKGRLC